ncbi:PorV/PorQ family protein [Rhodothermus bifroesti]
MGDLAQPARFLSEKAVYWAKSNPQPAGIALLLRPKSPAVFILMWIRRLLSALLLSVSPLAQAQESELGGFAFLRLPPSARAAALSTTPAAVQDSDVALFLLNPALLHPSQHRYLHLGYLNHVADVRFATLAYGWDQGRWGTLGLGLRFVDWGRIDEADASGNRLGTFRPLDVALSAGFGRAYGANTRYGIALHFIHTALANRRATALAFDAGVLYNFPEHLLSLSATLHALGITLQHLGATADRLPFDIRLSLRKRLRYLPLTLLITAYDLPHLSRPPTDQPLVGRLLYYLNVGAELTPSSALQLRLGYSYRQHDILKMRPRLDLAGLNAGFGLAIAAVYVDYAFSSWSSLGVLHYLTLRFQL